MSPAEPFAADDSSLVLQACAQHWAGAVGSCTGTSSGSLFLLTCCKTLDSSSASLGYVHCTAGNGSILVQMHGTCLWQQLWAADVIMLSVEHLTHIVSSCFADGDGQQQEPQQESMPAAAMPRRTIDTALGAGVRIHIHLSTSHLWPSALLYIAWTNWGECSPSNMLLTAVSDSAWLSGGAVFKPIWLATNGLWWLLDEMRSVAWCRGQVPGKGAQSGPLWMGWRYHADQANLLAPQAVLHPNFGHLASVLGPPSGPVAVHAAGCAVCLAGQPQLPVWNHLSAAARRRLLLDPHQQLGVESEWAALQRNAQC